MKTTDPTTAATWRLNSTGDLGTQAFTGALGLQPGEWFLQEALLGAFRIDGNVAAIPEPSAVLLLAAGLGMVVLRKRWPLSSTAC